VIRELAQESLPLRLAGSTRHQNSNTWQDMKSITFLRIWRRNNQ